MVRTSAPSRLSGQREAGVDPPPVDQDRAGAALAAVAALLGSGQIEPLAQEIEKRHPRIVELDVPRLPLTVRLMERVMCAPIGDSVRVWNAAPAVRRKPGGRFVRRGRAM